PRCASCCCPTSHCLAVLLHPQRPPPSTLFPYTTLFRSSLSSKSTAFPPGGNTMVGMRLQGSARRVGRRERRRARRAREGRVRRLDRKSTRLNSSHVKISYAVFCLKKKTRTRNGTADCPQ